MKETVCSEKSAHKIKTTGNSSKETIQYSEQGRYLKSRTLTNFRNMAIMFLCFKEKKRKSATNKTRINGQKQVLNNLH